MNEIFFMKVCEDCIPKEYDELLSAVSGEKRERIQAFKYDIDKKLSLYADIMVRYLACQTLNIQNQTLGFCQNKYGKPFILGYPIFHYNISHTRNAVVVGIAEKSIGVDIERVGTAQLNLARRFFSVSETEYILSGKDKDKRFYEIWTKKEAYIKWLGKGLSIPLHSFHVLDSDKKIALFEIDGYFISVCMENVEELQEVTQITEMQFISIVCERMKRGEF